MRQVVEEKCEGSCNKKHLGVFMSAVTWSLSDNELVQRELEERGIKLKDFGRRINEYARNWFVQQMELQQNAVK